MAMDDPNWWRQNKGVPIPDDQEERTRYCGFTLTEFVELGALNTSKRETFQPNNLKGIHPVFAQDKWEKDVPAQFTMKRKLYPLGKDRKNRLRDGYWTGHNPLVWKALEPSLKLASKFVENAHLFPWVRLHLFDQTSTGEVRADFYSMTL